MPHNGPVSYTHLPALTDEPAVLGTWNGIPVCAALGDNQASFLGSVSDPDGALINIGTGSQISFLSDSTECPDTMEARPYAGGKFLWAASALCGGRAYALLKQFFEQCIEMAGLKPPALYLSLIHIYSAPSRTKSGIWSSGAAAATVWPPENTSPVQAFFQCAPAGR